LIAAQCAGKRLGEKRQALVHPVIDTGMVVGELRLAMCDARLVQSSHEPAGTVEQIELIEERWANWLRQDPVVAVEEPGQ
jgi:hypothetical protein